MYQGETVTTTFSGLPFLLTDIKEMKVVFRTTTKILVTKSAEDCVLDNENKKIVCTLSGADTINFPLGPIERHGIFTLKSGRVYEYACCPIMCRQTAGVGDVYVPPEMEDGIVQALTAKVEELEMRLQAAEERIGELSAT